MYLIKGTTQLLHYFIRPMSGVISLFCTFVYAFNEREKREVLIRGGFEDDENLGAMAFIWGLFLVL